MIERELDNYNTLPQAFFALAAKSPTGLVYKYAEISPESYQKIKEIEKAERSWKQRNFTEVASRVSRLSRYLSKVGVKKGDCVAIISNSRPEWLEADFAVMCNGAVVVSIYQSLPAKDIGYILFDSGAKFVFAENDEQLEKLVELEKLECPIPKTEERDATTARISVAKIITFEKTKPHPLAVTFEEALRESGGAPAQEYLNCTREDLATLVYTSGTTGPPKGVMQTHGNHLSNIRQAYQAKIYSDNSTLMLVLPLAHSFAKLMGYIAYTTTAGVSFSAVASPKSSKLNPNSVSRDLRESGAEIFPLVPRLTEKMKEAIEERASKRGLLPRLLRRALRSAEIIFRARNEGKSASPRALISYTLTAPIRKKIRRQIFGTNFQYVISGGAKLPIHVARFFDALGIEIMEGYGLTETCVATNVNRRGAKKIGTVGPVLAADIEMKTADDGEILFRGPNVTKGYLNRPVATSSAWDAEGWFHTGDLGAIDEQGFLTITGRKKEIIVTAGGKKIAPEGLEERFKAIPSVSQVMVYGEGEPFCVALVAINAHDRVFLSGAQKDAFLKNLWDEVEKVNSSLASFETVKKILILKEEFTVENGLLTPTFKAKRSVVTKRYQDRLDSMYSTEQGENIFFE